MLSDSNINRILEAAMSKSADFAEVFYEDALEAIFPEEIEELLMNGIVKKKDAK